MQSVRHPAGRRPLLRRGFTLVELLVVIVVIGILVALLVPAVTTSITRAREAQVVTELSTFDSGLVNFKSKFGVDVPSFIVLYENSANWDPSNPAAAVSDVSHRASRAFIRQAWPDFHFFYGGDAMTPGLLDINGDGDTADVLILNGAECLAFFLGGIFETDVVDTKGNLKPMKSAGDPIKWWAPTGFSTNPQLPFSRGGNRTPLSANFEGGETGRFVDYFVTAGEFMPEYRDPLNGQTRPYLYASSYGGRGYQPFGPDNTVGDPSGTAADILAYADNDLPDSRTGGMNKIYFTDNGETTPYNAQTYQIVSPGGVDFEYGTGGYYNNQSVGSSRTNERDNITNFKKGRLQ